MSFGFGVGDFIAVGNLITEIVSALRGARSEYQELIRELDNLQTVLKHVDHLRGPRHQTVNLDSIKCAALTCRYTLEEFLSRVTKYEPALGLYGSGNAFKNAGKRVQWVLSRKDQATQLRNYLNVHIGIINMMMINHGLGMLDVVTEEADNQSKDLQKRLADSNDALQDAQDSIGRNGLVAADNHSMLKRLFGVVTGDIIAPLQTLQDLVAKVCVSTQQIFTLVVEIRSTLTSIDTRFTYFQKPVNVEDARGWDFQFPAELSIDALHAEIKHRFRSGDGSAEVALGSYEIFNARDAEEVFLTSDSALILTPSMQLVKAIVVAQPFERAESCPRPRCPSKSFKNVPGGGRICTACNIWFDQVSKKRKTTCTGEDLLKDVRARAGLMEDEALVEVDDQPTHRRKRRKLPKKTQHPTSQICARRPEDYAGSINLKNIRLEERIATLDIIGLIGLFDDRRSDVATSDYELRDLIQRIKAREGIKTEMLRTYLDFP